MTSSLPDPQTSKPTCQILGHGELAIVLLTGLGVPAQWWHTLGDDEELILSLIRRETWDEQPFLASALAQAATVVTYDRAGLQEDRPARNVRGLDDLVQELSEVLKCAEVRTPLVLVAHSLGGLIALEYAQRHRQRVAGLVLIDSSHPDQLAHFEGGASAEQRQVEQEQRQGMTTDHPERPDLEQLLRQGDDAARPGLLGDLPLLVLTRGAKAWADVTSPAAHMTADYWQHREQTWQALQRDLASLSSKGQQQCFPESGHYIHLDEPVQVLEAIRAFPDELPEALKPDRGSKRGTAENGYSARRIK